MIYFAGPLKLKQGGYGVVGRLPIYKKNKFWGFSSIVIRLEKLIEISGIKSIDESNCSLSSQSAYKSAHCNWASPQPMAMEVSAARNRYMVYTATGDERSLANCRSFVNYDLFDEGDQRRYPLKVPPMTLKKYAAGKGNAKKQEMLLQIYKRWGVEFNDDNAADSYALARLVGKFSINEVEKTVATQMQDPKYRDAPRF